jgi:ABC-type uncharacterized transport system permease subunit
MNYHCNSSVAVKRTGIVDIGSDTFILLGALFRILFLIQDKLKDFTFAEWFDVLETPAF